MATRAAAAYRQLLRQTAVTEMLVEMPVPGGFLQAVRQRYRSVVERNLELPPEQHQKIVKIQQESFARIMEALAACPENETLASIARALSTGFGNDSYRATLFRHFAETLEFDEERERRDEVSVRAVSDRQNRLMQAATFPYLEKLCTLSSPTLQNDTGSMLRALASHKAGVAVQLFPCDPHFVAIEIDEDLNKQTVYVSAPTDFDFEQFIEYESHRVDTAQLETQPGTILHMGWLNAARRVLDALTDESAIHRSRGTVVVGHGVGGAVATAVAAMLHAESYPIRNVVTFGAPKVVEEMEEATVRALNSIRVVMAGDPLQHAPTSGMEGGLFQHIGEGLHVASPTAMKMYPLQKPKTEKKKQKKSSAAAAAAAADAVSAENLFSMMDGEDTTAAAAAAAAAAAPLEEEEEEEQRENVAEYAKQQLDADEAALSRPYSVLAYRVALADPNAVLEYFEEDASVWESDDVREAFVDRFAEQAGEHGEAEGEAHLDEEGSTILT